MNTKIIKLQVMKTKKHTNAANVISYDFEKKCICTRPPWRKWWLLRRIRKTVMYRDQQVHAGKPKCQLRFWFCSTLANTVNDLNPLKIWIRTFNFSTLEKVLYLFSELFRFTRATRTRHGNKDGLNTCFN